MHVRPIATAGLGTHCPFASGAGTEQNIVRAVHVVFDCARHIAPQHLVGVQLKIGFEASASEKTDMAAISHDEHSRTRFAIGRSYGTYDRREYFASAIPQQAVEDQFKARVESSPEPARSSNSG